ncbi:MlaE family ABC transporter permease [Polyangium jinanense]|uniref:ABC transporter permease n=1 Tax=Polyangium jinanense TaxID=2829994 RepID=A0A9X3WYS5_9BACT|nr:ABC transporter permease [Polyangium jinanense]MDC3954466.1 ABC transporter permease [Polyangium jinanense]MDC3980769.1 ABC transporter permease [Polyangium jinanense]
MDDSEPKLLQRILDPVLGFFENIGTTVSLTLQTVAWLFRPPFRIGQMLAAMDFIGFQSTFLVGLTGLFSGMVVALQSVYALKQFSAEANVGGIVAVSLMREVSPVFSALMITARAGSGMAAELGNMRVTEQIDAITTMGVSPVQYLLSPRLLAGVTMGPLMCMLYSTIGMVGCYLVAVALLGGDWGFFLRSIHDFARPRDLFMGLIKGSVFGFLITSIACRHGYFASGGARGVGMATTRAVVESCVAILVANYILTQVMLGDI